ncbi:chondroitin sulfate synthase 1-like [Anoplophora glabripennis]|uniref:chondroitin sulfate synthase 1-like n=1 Tax=Anoplophora glabripennis TaxID=217634 RepID=UPI0008747436|nr:chondroitin sulfate synthase 1-like [Anoplophora glabripennis]
MSNESKNCQLKKNNFLLNHNYYAGRPTSINRYAPTKLEDVLEWELISKTLYSHRDLNPRKRIGSSLKEGLGDITREIMQLINSFSKQRGRVIDFKEILYGYWRLDPVYGVDLILDMLLVYKKYRGHKMTVQVRRHAYIQQTFTGIFVKEVDNHEYPAASQYPPSTEPLPVHKKLVHQLFSKLSENLQPILNLPNATRKTYVNFVLPLSGRFDTFRRFLRTYEDVCLKEKEYSRLYVVLYRNDDSPTDFEKTARLLEDVSRKYDDSEIRVIRSNDTFARGKALQLGVNALSDEELLLFIDVDMVFDRKSLERVRRNAARGRAIYFPIVYSLYDPALSNKSYTDADHEAFTSDCIDEETGFWRQFGFGIVGLYKSDYLALGGFNLMISGWGYEDVTFYDNAVKSGLRIARSVDPDLVHVFHSVRCDDHLDIEQKSMCVGTRASTLGSVGRLQSVYLRHRDLFR